MISRKEQSKIIDNILKEAKDMCPESGCIGKKPNGSWGVMSNKTGKWWPANYKTKKDAEDGLKAYHVHKGAKTLSQKSIELYWEAVRSIMGPRKGEKWLDSNNQKLTQDGEVKTLQDAKNKVYSHL